MLNVYDEVLLFITEHKVAEKWLSGNGLQKASTSRTDPLHNVLLTFLPFVMKYLEISKPNYREGEGGSIHT